MRILKLRRQSLFQAILRSRMLRMPLPSIRRSKAWRKGRMRASRSANGRHPETQAGSRTCGANRAVDLRIRCEPDYLRYLDATAGTDPAYLGRVRALLTAGSMEDACAWMAAARDAFLDGWTDRICWLHRRCGPDGRLSETDHEELIRHVQLDGMPLVICRIAQPGYAVCLDETRTGVDIRAGYPLRTGFSSAVPATAWILRVFGPGNQVTCLDGLLRPRREGDPAPPPRPPVRRRRPGGKA